MNVGRRICKHIFFIEGLCLNIFTSFKKLNFVNLCGKFNLRNSNCSSELFNWNSDIPLEIQTSLIKIQIFHLKFGMHQLKFRNFICYSELISWNLKASIDVKIRQLNFRIHHMKFRIGQLKFTWAKWPPRLHLQDHILFMVL